MVILYTFFQIGKTVSTVILTYKYAEQIKYIFFLFNLSKVLRKTFNGYICLRILLGHSVDKNSFVLLMVTTLFPLFL